VPAGVSLGTVGVLGVVADRQVRAAILRWCVAQLTGLHAPSDIALTLIVDDPQEWAWARWLPHLRRSNGGRRSLRFGYDEELTTEIVTELVREIANRRGESERPDPHSQRHPWSGNWIVLVLDNLEVMSRLPALEEILRLGPPVGVVTLCGAEKTLELPGQCRATVVACQPDRLLRIESDGRPPVGEVVIDAVSVGWAERFSRGLAPLRTRTGRGAAESVPAEALLSELVTFGSPSEVAAQWRARPRSTTAMIGVGINGATTVDLVRDGPHCLVAGTTGSGKSELLRTLVASLAMGNSPSELSFLLVDYKGGAAFADCAELPHTIGLVTDLDTHLTARALASLGAELKRRERLLLEAGAPDLEAFLELRSSLSSPPLLNRLVIVVDEFATLASELPDFVTGLVDIARRGRSLGIHLVLATQRPHGIISAEIRANLALRIALRMTDNHDSHDVIDSPHAARILTSTPGRAFLRTSSPRLTEIQTAQVSCRSPHSSDGQPQLEELTWRHIGSLARQPEIREETGPTDLTLITDTLRQAADLLGATPTIRPWLPPLPGLLTLQDLHASDERPLRATAPSLRSGEPAAGPLLLGLADHPAQQYQAPLGLDLATGEALLISGGPCSGRTTALRTLVAAVTASYRPDEAHLYILDCSGTGELLALSSLHHCGAAVAGGELARVERLLVRLSEAVEQRLTALVEGGYNSIAEQRADPAQRPLPWIVLLLDSWEPFVRDHENLEQNRCLDILMDLIRGGGRVGVTVVLTGGRALLTSPVASLIRRRLLLRPAAPDDYALAGLPASITPTDAPPGRAVIPAGDQGVELQIAVLGKDPSGRGQTRELLTRTADPPPQCGLPFRVNPLPALVRVQTLKPPPETAECPLWTPLGIGGDEATTLGVDLAALGGLLLTGPPGSGRTTALRTILGWHAAHEGRSGQDRRVIVVAPPRSPLAVQQERYLRFDSADPRLQEELKMRPGLPTIVVIDDLDLLTGSPADDLITELLLSAPGGTSVIAAGNSGALHSTFSGISVPLRRNRCGVILQPAPLDGELLGVPLGRSVATRHPGRGVLVVRETVLPIQLAMP
jgi:S-DNA-T family DNA segregation ATPase FtsK/SpoIIIE